MEFTIRPFFKVSHRFFLLRFFRAGLKQWQLTRKPAQIKFESRWWWMVTAVCPRPSFSSHQHHRLNKLSRSTKQFLTLVPVTKTMVNPETLYFFRQRWFKCESAWEQLCSQHCLIFKEQVNEGKCFNGYSCFKLNPLESWTTIQLSPHPNILSAKNPKVFLNAAFLEEHLLQSENFLC